jgi:hypothetical protein
MKEAQAKKYLLRMLKSHTGGSVLHLLSELYAEWAKLAHQHGDDHARKQAEEVAATLMVVGNGVDSICPRASYWS